MKLHIKNYKRGFKYVLSTSKSSISARNHPQNQENQAFLQEKMENSRKKQQFITKKYIFKFNNSRLICKMIKT